MPAGIGFFRVFSPLQGELVHGVEVGEVGVLVLQQGGKDVGGVRLLGRGDKLRDLGQRKALCLIPRSNIILAYAIP